MIWDEQVTKYNALSHWFKTPQGLRVAKAFTSELTNVSELLSGHRLLQLGDCYQNTWMSQLNFNLKWIASPCETSNNTALITSLTSLPIDKHSVDCVIAPLTLDAFGLHKNPLFEIDRVLKPMGHVIFFGVNPWSFWGAGLRLGCVNCFGEKVNTLTSSIKLKNTLLSMGYSQCMLNSFYYIPPVTHPSLIQSLEFLNEMGKMIWPFPAAFYCLIMQKYQPLTPPFILNQYDDEFLYVARN